MSVQHGKSINKKSTLLLETHHTDELLVQLCSVLFFILLFYFLDVIPLVLETVQPLHSYYPELKGCAHKHTLPINRASVMAPGKNLPQSAQSDSFYYLLITLLLQAGEFSNLQQPAGRRVEEEAVFPAQRDKRPSQVVQEFCILTRLSFLLRFYLCMNWRNVCV